VFFIYFKEIPSSFLRFNPNHHYVVFSIGQILSKQSNSFFRN